MTQDEIVQNRIFHYHDTGYKYLMSHNTVLMQLLHSFIHSSWVEKVEPKSILQAKNSFISSELVRKEADLVLQAKLKGHEVYFYILLEFQSSVDYQMPYRLLTYIKAVWDDLLRDQPKTGKEFKLPVVIPIVLYNGTDQWKVPVYFKEIQENYHLYDEAPVNFKYYLLDVNGFDEQELVGLSNLIGSAFLMDQSYEKTAAEIYERLKKLESALRLLEPCHFYAFKQWLGRVVCRNLSGKAYRRISKLLDQYSQEEVDLMGANLSESVRELWEKGLEKGIEKGERKKQVEIAKCLIMLGFVSTTISKATGLSLDEVEQLQRETVN